MPTEFAKGTTSADLLRQVLLDYIQTSRVIRWPGADGLTVEDILDCYPRAIAAGDVPDWPELCRRHAELIGEIDSLFAFKVWPDLESPTTQSKGAFAMNASVNEHGEKPADPENCRLHRWLVSFASESGWYPVGEYVALDAATAIERAVEVFGPGAGCQAEEIPWDAAPLSKANLPPAHR